jgi:hypothetical protein
MVRKLLKTKNNKDQIRFILMVSSQSWPLNSKIRQSKLNFRYKRFNHELHDQIAISSTTLE